MIPSPEAADFVRREIELYRDVSLFSMQDHREAMRCFDLQDLLDKGIQAFRSICKLDESYRQRVFKNETEYSEKFESLIDALYQTWQEPCEAILAKLQQFEADGFRVDHADGFRTCCREVAGILTPDDQFFTTESLVNLRDAALDSYARGETNEYTV